MKKLVFMFVALAAMSFASCGGNKTQEAPVDSDSVVVDSAATDSAATDTAAVDSAAAATEEAPAQE